MPTYNADHFLEKAILSIFQSNETDVELCISDNYSSDNTIPIIHKYQKKFPIKYIQKKDRGVGEALNNAFTLASGEIISWLDADDEYKSGTLKFVANFFKSTKNRVPFIYGKTDIIDEESNIIGQFRIEEFNKKKWLNEWHHIVFNSIFFSRDVMIKTAGFNYLGNDLDFYLRVSKYYNLTMIEKKFSNYRIHNKSISFSDSEFSSNVRYRRAFQDALLVLKYRGSVFSPRFLSYLAVFHGKYKNNVILKFLHKFKVIRYLAHCYRYCISQPSQSRSYLTSYIRRLFKID